MKNYFAKCRIILLAAIMLWCVFPNIASAEEHHSHCYPTEEQIQEYKKDGTWEKRQEYAKNLNHASPSQELLYNAIRREQGIARFSRRNSLPENLKEMQVTGDAKMLLVRVEFADIKFEDSKIYSEEEFYGMIMGDENTGIFPYESLNAYYKRSSYGKLNIISDQVYNCTLSKNRYEYEWEDSGEQDLLKEVMEILDDTVDFSDYDANNDGRLDGICINFAGENTGWGSTWWSHKYEFLDNSVMYDGVTPAGYIFLETYMYDDSYGTQTLIHEVGHMLGLPDYYSQSSDGIGTVDMMNNNSGDHNGFSKWLLGWLEDDNILRINSESGDTEVALAPLASEMAGDNKLIAVVAPQDTSIYSEYFVVQYDEYMGNQSVFELEKPSYRIFHVNAGLNDEGTNFEYDNIYAYNKLLIKAAAVVEGEYEERRTYYGEGDALTPDTNESSAFYGGDIIGFTGIELTDFKTGEEPSFQVSFREKEVIDGKLEFQIMGGTPLNMMELTLLSNKPLINAWSEEQAYLEDADGKRHWVDLYAEDGKRQIEVSYADIANSLKSETEYTLVIPAGMFQIDEDVYSEECRINVKTGVFPEIVADYQYEYMFSSDIFNINDTKAGFIEVYDFTDEAWVANLHIYEDTKEKDVIRFEIPLPGSYTEIMEAKVVPCYDGTFALQVVSGDPVDYSSVSSFYKMDPKGNILAGPFSIAEKLDIFPAGNGVKGITENSGALGSPALEDGMKLEIHTIDFVNEPTSCMMNINKYMSKTFALDKESYVVIRDSDQGYKADIFNNEDELKNSMDLSVYVNGNVCAALKEDNKLVVVYSTYLEGEEHAVQVSEFDMEGAHLSSQEIMRVTGWKDIDGWKLEKTNWGYSLHNYTAEEPYMIWFLNDEFEIISSMQAPDTLSTGTHIGSRCVVKWYDLTTWGERVAFTEPIADEEAEVVPKPDEPTDEKPDQSSPEEDAEQDDKPDSDKLSEDKTSGNTPKTSDTNHLVLLLAAVIISGGIIVKNLKHKWLCK